MQLTSPVALHKAPAKEDAAQQKATQAADAETTAQEKT
jgi:hypothetical protein